MLPHIILASKSPQRIRILQNLGISFKTKPTRAEKQIQENELEKKSPAETAEYIAMKKATSIREQYNNSLIIGVDTLVVNRYGHICEKPESRKEAKQMILDKTHTFETVISGICILYKERITLRHASTKVFFKNITSEDADTILSWNEWQGRSGAFSVEGKTSLFIEKIEGDFHNVVGFPVPLFGEMMQSISPLLLHQLVKRQASP